MVLLVVGRVVLAAPAGLPASTVWRLGVAAGRAQARAAAGLRSSGQLAAFGATGAWPLFRP